MNRAWSIRSQLLLLIIGLVLPFIALHIYVGYKRFDSSVDRSKDLAFSISQLTAADAEHFLFDARQSLARLAERPGVKSLENPCDPVLAAFPNVNANFQSINLIRMADETVVCSSLKAPERELNQRIGTDHWLAQHRKQQTFIISPPFIDQYNDRWMIVLAYPVVGGPGNLIGAVAATVDLLTYDSVHYKTGLEGNTLPPGASVTIVDKNANIIARWPNARGWVGSNNREVSIVKNVLQQQQGTTRATGLDGIVKLYGFSEIGGTDWYLYVGLPVSQVTVPIWQFLLQDSFLCIAIALSVLAAAVYFSNRIARPIRALAKAARTAAQGNLGIRIPVNGPREIYDVSESFNTMLANRSHSEEELFQEKERAEITLHSIGDAVIATNADFNITYLNPVAEQLTGWSSIEAIKRPLMEVVKLIDSNSGKPIDKSMADTLRDGYLVRLKDETLLINRTGKEYHVADCSAPIYDREGNMIGTVLVFRDVSRTHELEERLSWQAYHDHLTGLVNRMEFERRLHDVIADAKLNGHDHALLYLDLDQFKIVNDTCGHQAGDELLRLLTERLQPEIRTADTFARLGGDEFGVLLQECPLNQALRIADHLREVIRDFRFAWESKVFTVGVSIGVVAITDASGDGSSVMHAADLACYSAKESGRNRVHIFHPEDDSLLRRLQDTEWVQKISSALEQERFLVYAQPIVPINGASPGGQWVEFLMRMSDDQGNISLPDTFLPAAERYNMLTTLDRWMIRNVFTQLAALNVTYPHTCFLNLSGHSLNDDRFLDFVIDQFAQTGLSPETICFEITENAAISNLSRATRFMTVLRGMKCRFALDDFGSGLSSFAYLKHLPVNYLKIYGHFVKDINVDMIDRAMVDSINRVGHVMGLQTIAEFVEGQGVLDQLKELGVDYAQGFALAKPKPIDHLEFVS